MGSGTGASRQAPFDKRIRTLAFPMTTNKHHMRRGYMIQQNSLPGYSGNRGGKFVFNFLYNPSTIEASYSVQTSGAALSYMFPNAGDAGDLAVPINQSVSWTVMFDRTYELNMGSYAPDGTLIRGSRATPTPHGLTADPMVYGVFADVLQLQFFTGMMLQGGHAKGSDFLQGSTNKGQTFNFKADQGFMMMVPSWVFFGSQANLNYFGYISAWDVTYTHFTQHMIPMRCVIDITFQMLPPPAPKGKTKQGGGSGSSGYYPIGGGKFIHG
jgi:hypothetical protein